MINKHVILFFLMMFLFSISGWGKEKIDTSGKSGKISLVLQGIKTEQANKASAESSLATAQDNLNFQKPDLEMKRDEKKAEAQRIFNTHDNKYEKGSANYIYWQGQLDKAISEANSYQDQIDQLQMAVDDAQQKVDDAEAALRELQDQLQVIGNISSTNWDCLYDGKCGVYGATPDKGKGFVVVPNNGTQITSGAPGIFTILSQEYKDRHNPDKGNVPIPKPSPEKSVYEMGVEKIKQIYNDLIKKAQQLRTRRVANAAVAVRG